MARNQPKTLKENKRDKLLEYLGNPLNEFPTRCEMSTAVLGHKTDNAIYRTFTPAELTEIESEALAIRRKKYAPELSKVDRAMLREASSGNHNAAKLCYQRFEDWQEGKSVDLKSSDGSMVQKPTRIEIVALMPEDISDESDSTN